MKWIKKEDGSAIYLAIWSLLFAGFLLIFIANIVTIFVVNAQASTAAEQASLAATGVLYDEIEVVIDTYQKVIIIEPEEEDEDPIIILEPLRDKVDQEVIAVQNSNPSLSANEVYITAVNNVLIGELSFPDPDLVLKAQIENAVLAARNNIGNVVTNIIEANGADSLNTEIRFFNNENRIEVRTQKEYESMGFSDWMSSQSADIRQVGVGLSNRFLDRIHWVNQTVTP